MVWSARVVHYGTAHAPLEARCRRRLERERALRLERGCASPTLCLLLWLLLFRYRLHRDQSTLLTDVACHASREHIAAAADLNLSDVGRSTGCCNTQRGVGSSGSLLSCPPFRRPALVSCSAIGRLVVAQPSSNHRPRGRVPSPDCATTSSCRSPAPSSGNHQSSLHVVARLSHDGAG